MKNSIENRWLRLAMSSLTLLFSGIIYAWSTISAPYKAEWSVLCSANYTLMMCMFCISGFVSGLLAKRISIKIRLIAAALCSAFGLTIATFTNIGPAAMFVGYGFLTGTGVGIAYNVIISVTGAYFPDKKGIASGVMMMSFGLGSFTLGMIAKSLFEIESFGWRKTYILFGVILGVLLLVSAFVTRMPDKNTVFPLSKKRSNSGIDMETKEVIKRASFWKAWIFFMLFAAVGSTAIADSANMLTSLGVNTNIAFFALLVPVCNAFGRIASGLIFDNGGLNKARFSSSLVVILATVITLCGFVFKISAIGIIGLLLCGFSYGFSPTVSAAFTSAFYGMKDFSLNFSLLNLILIPASFFPTLSALLVNSSKSYVPSFAILVFVSLIGLAVNASIKKP